MFYILCPPMVSQSLPSTVPSARFARAIQDSLPGVRATHGQMPLNPCNFQLPLRTSEPDAPSWKNNFCEAATGILAGMSCLSFSCLAAGVHSILPLACFTGCFAGVGAGLGGLCAEASSEQHRGVVQQSEHRCLAADFSPCGSPPDSGSRLPRSTPGSGVSRAPPASLCTVPRRVAGASGAVRGF